MASATDFYNELKAANARLDDVKTKLDTLKNATDAVRAAVQHVDTTMQWGLTQLINLGTYTNQALWQNSKQNDTIICILEQISKNTCILVNESTTQTSLQKTMRESLVTLADLYATTHSEAALERQKLEALKHQIERCCPPPVPAVPCDYRPCPKPEVLREPPRVDNRPPRSATLPPDESIP